MVQEFSDDLLHEIFVAFTVTNPWTTFPTSLLGIFSIVDFLSGIPNTPFYGMLSSPIASVYSLSLPA